MDRDIIGLYISCESLEHVRESESVKEMWYILINVLKIHVLSE